MFEDGWYWYSLPWATGAICVRDGVIVDGAPIFRKMIGWKASAMRKGEYKWIGPLDF